MEILLGLTSFDTEVLRLFDTAVLRLFDTEVLRLLHTLLKIWDC